MAASPAEDDVSESGDFFRPDVRWHLAGLSVVAAGLGLTWLSYQATAPMMFFVACMALGWAGLACGIAYATPTGPSTTCIVLYGLAARVACACSFPIYEDDWARYLWDGWRVSQGQDPYSLPPETFFSVRGLPSWTVQVLDQINNPSLPTIYGPVCQMWFGTAACIHSGSWWAWKLIACGAELLLMLLVARTLSPRSLLIYAWCPLPLFEVWVNAHPEALAALPLFSGFLLLRSRSQLAGALVGVALATRLHVLPIALVLAVFGCWRVRLAICYTIAACYLPFLALGIDPGLHTTATMAATWEFNSFLPAVLRPILGDGTPQAASLLGLSGMVAIAFICRRKSMTNDETIVWAGCWWLLSSMVVNPWYALALLPFIARQRNPWALAFVAGLSLSYVRGTCAPDGTFLLFDHAWWIRPAELLIALSGGWWLRGRLSRSRHCRLDPSVRQVE